MYKIAAGVTMLVCSLGLATAEEFTAVITKVDGGKVTLTKYEKGQKGDDATLTAASEVKVTKSKGFGKKKGGEGDPIEGGLKSDTFAKGNKVTARVTTNDDGKITAIAVRDVLKANELNAIIKKVDGSTITYVTTMGFGGGFNFKKKGDAEKKDDEKKKEEILTMKATSSCKVLKGKFDIEAMKLDYTTVEDGLKSDVFKEEVRARITVNDDKQATEIKIAPAFGGGKKGKKKNDTTN